MQEPKFIKAWTDCSSAAFHLSNRDGSPLDLFAYDSDTRSLTVADVASVADLGTHTLAFELFMDSAIVDQDSTSIVKEYF